MGFASVPAVVHRADDLLPAARMMIDQETASLEADPNVHVACGPNCNACCEHAVAVTPAELRAIKAALAELPAATQRAILSRASAIRARLEAEIPRDVDEFPRRYYALAEPCPLLVEGSCSVREVRPLVCREYLMSSPPEHCSDRNLEHTVKIRRQRRVSTGYHTLSARFGDAKPKLLSIALLEPVELPCEAPRSGPKLAHLLTTS